MKSRFINPYTDFGFKKLFGEEASKHLLMDFLNSMLPAHHQIAELNFKNNEQIGINDDDRKAVYDIYCESVTGEKFIVELQRVKQRYFKERTLFYTTFPIREQTKKGNGWNYKLEAIYCISVLDFTFDNYRDNQEVLHTVQLKDQNNQIFYDKLTFIYLEMPNFHKQESELESNLDKWLFFIKNLDELQNIPLIFKDDTIFKDAFIRAEIANLNDADHYVYMDSLKKYWDFMSALDTYMEEGRRLGLEQGLAEGIEQGLAQGLEQGKELGIQEGERKVKLTAITNLKQAGMSDEQIRQILSIDMIEWNALNNDN